MRKRILSLCGAILLATAATRAEAQTVRGLLVDEASGQTVAGALVTLVDAQGAARAGALSGADGSFVIRAPRDGSYHLRAERIGYVSSTSPVFRLTGDETHELTLRVASTAVSLEGINVVAARRQRCAVRPEQGLEAYAIWEEVRKALSAAAWTDEQASFLFDQTVYEDALDARATQVTEVGRRQTGRVRRPFYSLPLERLLNEGFVQNTDSGTFYFAPDAQVLLSDQFLDHHCFRAAEPHPGESALVGLSFEPARRGGSTGIDGTLWIDRRTSELRYLEFGYPSPHAGISNATLGGRLEFYRLPSGEWIVRRWWLRTPRIGQQAGRTASGQPLDQHVLIGLTEHGGEIQRVSRRNGEVVFSRETVVGPQLPVQVALAQPDSPGDEAGDTVAGAPHTVNTITAGTIDDIPAPRPRRRDPSLLTRYEIVAAGARNVFELVQAERPQWLRQRGQNTLRLGTVIGPRGDEFEAMTQIPIVVYHDGIRLGDVTTLRNIPTQQIASVRFVGAREATQRWGSDHTAGVILLSSR
jgi:hypothetical protein